MTSPRRAPALAAGVCGLTSRTTTWVPFRSWESRGQSSNFKPSHAQANSEGLLVDFSRGSSGAGEIAANGGYSINYLLGLDEARRLRGIERERAGSAWSTRQFHSLPRNCSVAARNVSRRPLPS